MATDRQSQWLERSIITHFSNATFVKRLGGTTGAPWGLVMDFAASVSDAIAEPLNHAVGPAGCRFVRVPRFPYVVLFDATDEEIHFLGVMHTARSIEKWRERLDPT